MSNEGPTEEEIEHIKNLSHAAFGKKEISDVCTHVMNNEKKRQRNRRKRLRKSRR